MAPQMHHVSLQHCSEMRQLLLCSVLGKVLRTSCVLQMGDKLADFCPSHPFKVVPPSLLTAQK